MGIAIVIVGGILIASGMVLGLIRHAMDAANEKNLKMEELRKTR